MTALPKSQEQDPGPLYRAQAKQFRLDVQALRGVAVLLVVLYHAQVVFPGGFVGVDVFLVISGFVIGQLLLRSLASTDTVGFGQFYLRRIRRLLPPLAVMLVVVLVLSPLLAQSVRRWSLLAQAWRPG